MGKIEAVTVFGERLREKIEATGITHAQFARSVGLTRATLSNYINGRSEPALGTLLLLSNKLETTPNYLLGVENHTSQNIDASGPQNPHTLENFSGVSEPHSPLYTPAQLFAKMQDNINTLNSTVLDLQERMSNLENSKS